MKLCGKKDVGVGPHKHTQVTLLWFTGESVAEQQVEFGPSEEKSRVLPIETA